MGKTREDILKEIMAELSAIRSALSAVEEKVAQLNVVEPQHVDPADPVIAPEAAPAADPEEVPQEKPEAVEVVPEVAEVVPEVVPEAAAVDEFRPVDLNELHMASRKKGLGEAMTEAQAWRTALPGSPVKDIRNAISLNDRLLFIRELFNGDDELFQSTIDGINTSVDFDSAADALLESNPQWDADSDIVYRFMMAVRRRLSAE